MNIATNGTSKKNEKGFTLVELLIVIVILGILATIVVFSVRGLTGKANTNSCKIDHRSMSTAIEAYFADTGAYPTGSAQLMPTFMEKVSTKWAYAGGAPALVMTGTVHTSGLKAVAPCVQADAT
jgi:prepilin-type N-terminal cleavage/methylation domain-containing protein